jgi:hypothetical protein
MCRCVWPIRVVGGPGVKPHGNRAAKRCMRGLENGLSHQRVSASCALYVAAADDVDTAPASLSRERRCQGRLFGRLALGIRFSVCIAVNAEALRFLAGAAVRRLAPSTISLAEVAAA